MSVMKRLALVLALSASAAGAQEPMAVERGREGLAPVPFRVKNLSEEPLACQAAIAHWYSLEVGRVAPGASLFAELWSDPRTGAVFLLNATLDRMPVQALWCGVDGKAFTTRFDVPLARRAGQLEPAIALRCTGLKASRLDCRTG